MVMPVFITIVVFSIFVAIINSLNNKRENGDYGWDEFANAMIVGAIASITNLTFYFCFKYLSTF